jgi:hypothetical protein
MLVYQWSYSWSVKHMKLKLNILCFENVYFVGGLIRTAVNTQSFRIIVCKLGCVLVIKERFQQLKQI